LFFGVTLFVYAQSVDREIVLYFAQATQLVLYLAVHNAVKALPQPMGIRAHGLGCLASVHAITGFFSHYLQSTNTSFIIVPYTSTISFPTMYTPVVKSLIINEIFSS
jgi:hypothetical protein